jgi:hypothetical protein
MIASSLIGSVCSSQQRWDSRSSHLPEPTVLASAEASGVGNEWATRAPETGRDDEATETAEVAV